MVITLGPELEAALSEAARQQGVTLGGFGPDRAAGSLPRDGQATRTS
jgi:hypothetical protein